jgi:hypothetical protein
MVQVIGADKLKSTDGDQAGYDRLFKGGMFLLLLECISGDIHRLLDMHAQPAHTNYPPTWRHTIQCYKHVPTCICMAIVRCCPRRDVLHGAMFSTVDSIATFMAHNLSM